MIYQTELKPMCETGYFNKQHLKPSVESDVLTNSTKTKVQTDALTNSTKNQEFNWLF